MFIDYLVHNLFEFMYFFKYFLNVSFVVQEHSFSAQI